MGLLSSAYVTSLINWYFFLAMSLLMLDFLYFSNFDLSGRQIIYLVKNSLFAVGEGLAPPGRRLPAEDQLVCVSRVFYGDSLGGASPSPTNC